MNNTLSLNLQLLQASRTGDYSESERLLSQGADPDFTPHSGLSPIRTAAKDNNLKLFKLFLLHKKSGSNINYIFNYACSKRRREIVQILLTPQILPSFAGREGSEETAEKLEKFNSAMKVQNLFFHHFKIDVNSDEDSYTPPPIMIACGRVQDEQILELLLLAGADVNKGTTRNLNFPFYPASTTPSDWTPLMETCLTCRKLSIATKLIDEGANIHTRNVHGSTALMVACSHLSSKTEVLEIIKMLIDKGADPKEQSNSGMTPLMYALRRCNIPMLFSTVKLLLKTKGHINLCDNQGLTPLMYACVYRKNREPILPKETASKKHIIKMLLKAGAKVNAVDKAGKTALFHACKRDEDREVLLLLLEAGADPEIADVKNHPNFIKHEFSLSKKRKTPSLSQEQVKKAKLSPLD